MKLSAPLIFNLQSGSGCNSLGGHRKSLTQGLFAECHDTWAETDTGTADVFCGGWQSIMQYGKSAFYEDVNGFMLC